MLIDLSLPLTIQPSEYPTTLAICIETSNRPECGVFAGRHQDFAAHEEGKKVPVVHDDGEGRVTFLLDRDRSDRQRFCRQWTYAAMGWTNSTYVDHAYVYMLALKEILGSGDVHSWAVMLMANSNPIFSLLLPDYAPGAVARGLALNNHQR